MYFQNLTQFNTIRTYIFLDICLKSPFSEDPLTANMVNGPKHCCNLNDSPITIFSDHFGGD